MTTYDLGKVVGSDGEDGVGIESITKTGTSGLVDTYTITYTDGTTTTFTVTNGEDGTADIVTSWESTLSDTKVASEKLTKNTIDTKLSSNQGSANAGKYLKVDTDGSVIPATGGGVDIVTSWESTLSDEKVASEKLVKDTLDTKANSSSLSTVATSGSYSDLSNKPSIPSKTSDLMNDSGFITSLPSASTSTAGIVQLIDNLTTNDDTKALTAKQGKAIADLIGDAITYINGSGT